MKSTGGEESGGASCFLSLSAIIKCVFVSAAAYAELWHHFLPHAAATFLVFNCLQLSRSLTDLYGL